MRVRIHDRGSLSWFQLGRVLVLSGIGAAQAARIVNVGRCLAVVMHEVIRGRLALAVRSTSSTSTRKTKGLGYS